MLQLIPTWHFYQHDPFLDLFSYQSRCFHQYSSSSFRPEWWLYLMFATQDLWDPLAVDWARLDWERSFKILQIGKCFASSGQHWDLSDFQSYFSQEVGCFRFANPFWHIQYSSVWFFHRILDSAPSMLDAKRMLSFWAGQGNPYFDPLFSSPIRSIFSPSPYTRSAAECASFCPETLYPDSSWASQSESDARCCRKSCSGLAVLSYGYGYGSGLLSLGIRTTLDSKHQQHRSSAH